MFTAETARKLRRHEFETRHWNRTESVFSDGCIPCAGKGSSEAPEETFTTPTNADADTQNQQTVTENAWLDTV